MIKVTTKNGLDLFIMLCDDVDPNKGGYYCEVYLDGEFQCIACKDNYTKLNLRPGEYDVLLLSAPAM